MSWACPTVQGSNLAKAMGVVGNGICDLEKPWSVASIVGDPSTTPKDENWCRFETQE